MMLWNNRKRFGLFILVVSCVSLTVHVIYYMLQSKENFVGIKILSPSVNKSGDAKAAVWKDVNHSGDETNFVLQLKKKLAEIMEKQNSNAAQVKQASTEIQQLLKSTNNMQNSLGEIKEALVYMRDVSTLYKNDYQYEASRKFMDDQIQNFKGNKSFLKQPSKYLLLDDVDIDTKVHYKMIVMVFSHSEENFEHRAAIRRLWGNSSNWRTKEKFKVIFLLGGIHKESTMKKIYDESQQHRDILLESVPEGYFTTTSKLTICLHWLSLQDWTYDFIFKTDDDVFVNIDLAMKHLSRMDYKKPQYFGNLIGGPKPWRQGRYRITEIEFPGDKYDNFISGSTTFMSKVLLTKIAPYFNFVNPLKLEDVYLASLIKTYGQTAAVHSGSYSLFTNKCLYMSSRIVIHPVKTLECMEYMTRKATK